ncbi:MAG: Obg family GTPase CgtA [Candidatus Omnitrophica bacterium]|nr:Obg family GTPase CgtA [Candidatus Omnitrophota bacterium]
MFIDEVAITVQSGSGGRGCESFCLRTDHKKVPDGGDGGKGGDIIFCADKNVSGLEDFVNRRVIRAEAGGSGGANFKTGRSSAPVVMRLPCGTLILNRETDLRIRDLADHGDEVVVAKGGRGGAGNQHGRRVCDPGEGHAVQLMLILKLVSHVALVGLPNSGKSLLLNQLTGARAKVDTYPFSTKSPQLGVFEASDYRQLKICELPGILEGSHAGKGLGNKFLRHLERTQLIVVLLDPFNDYKLGVREGYKVLLHELGRYAENIPDIPRMIVVNKSDLPGFAKRLAGMKSEFKEPVFLVSALTGNGIDKLKQALERAVS